MDDDAVRGVVAGFVLDNANESECLFEVVSEAYIDSLPDGYDDPGYSEEEDRRLTELAYAIHRRAKVSVVIDGVEYSE